MSRIRSIPVRVGTDLLRRLDWVATNMGSNRAAVIRLCVDRFVTEAERAGEKKLYIPGLKALDGRSQESQTHAPLRQAQLNEQLPDYEPNPKKKK